MPLPPVQFTHDYQIMIDSKNLTGELYLTQNQEFKYNTALPIGTLTISEMQAISNYFVAVHELYKKFGEIHHLHVIIK